jgi:Amt family ammonium transporter
MGLFLSLSFAEEAKPPAAGSEPPKAEAPAAAPSAPAATAAPAEPKPDPAGIATGDKSTAIDAGGNSFVVSEPTDKADPDYAKKKKDFDEYQAQASKEPLAAKLADSVGHIRIATNFSWTLLTGYLVLFMQAGFALLTCGLVRKKNAAHLMMLNFAAYVFAF